jgi:hypothetical protein
VPVVCIAWVLWLVRIFHRLANGFGLFKVHIDWFNNLNYFQLSSTNMFRWTGNVLWRTKCTRSKTNVRNGTNASMHWCLCTDGEWPPRQWGIPRKNCTPCCSGFVVREVLMIHVGGTRDVAWSIDQSIQIHLGCWIDPNKFFFMVFFDVWLHWWVWSRLTLFFDLTFRWHACLHRHSALWKRNHAVLHVRGECLALV